MTMSRPIIHFIKSVGEPKPLGEEREFERTCDLAFLVVVELDQPQKKDTGVLFM